MGAQARDGQVGEVLAHPAAVPQDHRQRGRDAGESRHIGEIAVDARAKLGHGLEEQAAGAQRHRAYRVMSAVASQKNPKRR